MKGVVAGAIKRAGAGKLPAAAPFREVLHGALQACAREKDLASGRRLRAVVAGEGLMSDVLLANDLVRVFAACGSLGEANEVFRAMARPNAVSLEAVITGHAAHGQARQAIALYQEMRARVKANGYVYVAVLKACGSAGALPQGKMVHAHVADAGMEGDVRVASALVDMYAKCGSVDRAREVFEKVEVARRDVVLWGAMISACAKAGCREEVMELVEGMRGQGIELNVFTGSTLVHMYAAWGRMDDARKVFDGVRGRNVVMWSAMIGGYARHGMGKEALEVFDRMVEGGVEPNKVTLGSVLQACGSAGAVDRGRHIHRLLVSSGDLDVGLANSVVDMYCRCGRADEGRRVFDSMVEKDLVSWNSMLGGYMQNEFGKEALQLFRLMQEQGVEPNMVTFLTVLRACASVVDLELGQQVHGLVVKRGLESDTLVGNTLLDMYAKCGTLDEAWKVFANLGHKDVISWSAIIGAYAQHGRGQEALQLFRQMQEAGLKPNEVTLVCVLSACSQAGLVDEGYRIYQAMAAEYGIMPKTKHFACMIDLLGRAGHLQDAEVLITTSPVQANAEVWTSMLAACQTHGDVELGRRAFEHVVKLDPSNAASYVLMSNIYAAAGRWQDQSCIRDRMKDAGVRKTPGVTRISVDAEVHSFVANDATHPQMHEIIAQLKSLMGDLKAAQAASS